MRWKGSGQVKMIKWMSSVECELQNVVVVGGGGGDVL